ncbi:MAG TPA: glycosyltransferase family 2 protein [Bryobacteraceae bacterium]|jgi:GT2 family glycosyltransferase
MSKENELERINRESEILAAENERLRLELREASERYQEMRGSLSWKVTAPLRRVLGWALGFGGRAASKDPLELNAENYRRWVAEYDRPLSGADRRLVVEAIERLPRRPQFSVLLVVRDPAAGDLRETLQSIRKQIYKDWELCVVDDGSTAPYVARMLADFGDDPRVRIVRDAVDVLAMARREYVTRIEAGDVLAETALFEIAWEIAAHPEAVVIYSDEDEIDASGERSNPKFKTGWNPDLLLSENYLGRLVVYRREAVAGARGTEYELALRMSSSASVRHVAAVLCHRRGAVEDVGKQVRWEVPSDAKVTVIIPTRDRAELLERCVDGLLHRTKYAAGVEIIIVDNASREERTRELFASYAALENVRVIPYPGEFNWSAMNNAGAKAATGEILLFLNNDTDVIEDSWLAELASQAARPEVGVVGAKLLYADRTVQHAGIWLGPGVFARHVLRLSKRDEPGYLRQLTLARNMSAVTGACMAMRRAVFAESGGFDESFPVSYSDLDLCLRLIGKGYRIVWTPYAELLHLESASRGSSESRWRKEQADRDRFCARWQHEMDNDPFFNPNLDLIGEEKVALAFPPRRRRAWRAS